MAARGRRGEAAAKGGRGLINPEELAKHYTRFRVSERILLTGHSHQAWPDVAFEAQQQAWLDAAEYVDDVWEKAFEKANEVRRGFARLLDDTPERIALAQNTHELVVRFLSALPLKKRPQLVTTDAEFHTIRRQLDRLAEEGIEVIKVPAMPAATLAERLAISVDDRTAAVLVSAVLYTNAHVVPHLHVVQEACERVGAELLVDAYHALNVVPFSLIEEGLQRAYVVGGGYKYCQLGPGNAFLRFPQDSDLRPVVTGWFSEFTDLSRSPAGGRVAYGPGPARFAGATYDFTSHYRASSSSSKTRSSRRRSCASSTNIRWRFCLVARGTMQLVGFWRSRRRGLGRFKRPYARRTSGPTIAERCCGWVRRHTSRTINCTSH